ncbi:MAG: hypothetical protein A2516_05920 [Alphaproteobacteria bacterium RIFOXYD12_FULL_60_8]|nr:MAG: hypothetical protein A2516_05920 [Alphaproteobacteria bacterium RIFOXYD12_FULL_60_8]
MRYTESRDAAKNYAQAAMTFMDEKGLAPNPNGFAVWYNYASENFPELKAQVDQILAEKGKVDDSAIQEIFAKFLSEEEKSDELRRTSERIEANLEKVMKFVATANQETSNYGETLENFSGNIANAGGVEEIRAMVASVVEETRSVMESNKKLESQLTESSSEINVLRQEMARVQHEASTDGLTGIPNRKTFDRTLAAAAKAAQSEGSFLCLLLTDIDHFKKFNDTFGHQMGDQVLKLVAHTMRQTVRGQDTACRYGGEEFAVILPKTQLREATLVAENIRKAVASKKLINRTKNIDLGQITLSIGVSEYSLGEPITALIERADAGLYAAKDAGRNRVITQMELGK